MQNTNQHLAPLLTLASGINVYDIMLHKQLVLSVAAVEFLHAKLGTHLKLQ
jgi:ribosomal protein L4